MKIPISKVKCQRCNHEWIPRKVEVRICPKCKTAYFDTPREQKNSLTRIKPKGLTSIKHDPNQGSKN